MRIVVGVAGRDADHTHALIVQQPHQSNGLGQVFLGHVLLAHAPAIGIGDAIVGVQANGQRQVVAYLLPRLLHDVDQKPGPALKAATVPTRPGAGA